MALTFEIRDIGDDPELVFEIFQASPGYFRRVENCEVTPAIAKKEISVRPSKVEPDYQLLNLVGLINNRPIAYAGLHLNHPKTAQVYLGLFILVEEFQGRGLGVEFFRRIQRELQLQGPYDLVKLGISEANDVSVFWEKVGFKPNGFTYTWKGENKTSHVTEYEMRIDD